MDPPLYPGGQIKLIFSLQHSGFRDNGWFSKLPYLAMKPGIWEMCQKLHMNPLSTPQRWNWAYFALRAAVSETCVRYGLIFKIAIFGHETWNLKNVPEVAYGPSFYPIGSKLSLFLLYMQLFPRYRPIFKVVIFGHETWNLKKVPQIAYGPSFYPIGSKLSLFLLYRRPFSR